MWLKSFLNTVEVLWFDGDAGAQGVEEIGGVVMEEDAGEDVLWGVVGDGLVQVFAVGGWECVESDVFEAGVEDGGVEEDESHVSGGFGGDVVGVDVGTCGEVVDGVDGVVDAEAHEGVAGEFGAEFGEIEGAEDGGFGFFGAGW